MSSNLYYEAIEAAEEIKQSAEEKVKQKLIESMTPQIKKLVESKLFEEEVAEKEELLTDEKPELALNDKKEENATKLDSKSIPLEIIDENEIKNILLKNAEHTQMFLKLESLKKDVLSLKKAKVIIENKGSTSIQNKKFVQMYKLLLKEIKNLKTNSIIKNNDDLLKEFYNINKEIDNMSRRTSNRYSENELDYLLEMNLFEEEDSEEESDSKLAGDSEEMDLESDSESGSDLDVEELKGLIDQAQDVLGDVEGLLGLSSDEDMEMDMEMDMDAEDEAQDSEDADEDAEDTEEDADEDAEDTEDEEIQLDGIVEMDLKDVQDIQKEYGCSEEEARNIQQELHSNVNESSYDRVLEIDENMLRREIGRMKSLREGEAKDVASHFGGGSLEGEAFVDGVELNKLHEMKIKAAKVLRKNRMLESKLSQYKKALLGMKGQLQEMNLFNAKLLYANKLMQNRDLSIKQQRHVVESLDEAKTLGEAKILFESLSKSLVSNKTATRGGNLSEGALRRRSGSSSAPVRSAQPINESVALDRWATLAGIKK